MSRFFGYRLDAAKRRLLPAYVVAFHLPFLILAVVFDRPWVFGWLAVMVLGNWLYNGPGVRLSRVPVVAELTATWIYLNILWLGALCSGVWPHWVVWLFAGAAILVFQIAGAIVDIEPDRLVRKMTFAVAVGRRWAASMLAAVVASKGILLLASFGAIVPALVNFAAIPLCLLGPARLRRYPPVGRGLCLLRDRRLGSVWCGSPASLHFSRPRRETSYPELGSKTRPGSSRARLR